MDAETGHPYGEAADPRKAGSCVRCGRPREHPIHDDASAPLSAAERLEDLAARIQPAEPESAPAAPDRPDPPKYVVIAGLDEETYAHVRRELTNDLEDEGSQALAAKLEADGPLSEEERATLDAIIHGTGFVVDGQRVPVDRVKMIRWDGP